MPQTAMLAIPAPDSPPRSTGRGRRQASANCSGSVADRRREAQRVDRVTA